MEFANTQKVLNEYARKLIAQYRDNLTADNSIARGALYNNITYKVNAGVQAFEVVITLEDYWKYVENGRRAGAKMPPINAIEEWITVKPIIPTIDSKGRLPTVRQLAYLIARSISIKGIPAKRGFQKAFDSLLTELYANLRNALVADVKPYLLVNISIRQSS